MYCPDEDYKINGAWYKITKSSDPGKYNVWVGADGYYRRLFKGSLIECRRRVEQVNQSATACR